MKKGSTLILAGLVALLALSPVIYMAFVTVYVDTVVVRPPGGKPGPGFRRATIRSAKALDDGQMKLKVDEDHFVDVVLEERSSGGFRPGDAIYFSPPPDVLKHKPGFPVTLYHDQPEGRMVLWARGSLKDVSTGRARINARKLNDLIVPAKGVAGVDLSGGARIRFRPEKTFSLVNYRGLAEETGPFLRALFRWVTFREADFPKRLGLLFNTLIVSILTTLAATVVGVLYALLLVKFDLPGRGVFSWIYIAPLLIPPYISAIAWTLVLGEEGTVSKFLKSTFSLEKAPFTIYGIPGSILVLSLSFFPIVTLLAQAGLRSISREQEEAGLLCASRWKVLRAVHLRLAAPYILSGAVFVFIFALSSSGAPALLRLQLYSSQVMVAFQTDLSGGEATATGTPLALLAVGAVVFQAVMLGRRRFASEGGVPLRFSLSRPARVLSFLACTFLLLLAAGVPLIVLVERAGSPDAFRMALVEMRSDIWYSIVIAAGAATAACVVGGFLGYLAARIRKGAFLEALLIIPYAAPASVVGAGLLPLWDRPGPAGWVYTSGLVLVLAGFTRFIPFAVKPASAAVRAVPPSLEEAAEIHGVSWRRRITGLVLPLAGRGFVAGWILVFILTLGELDASILVAPAGITTVPIRVFNAIHFGRVEVVSALCLILVFIASFPLMLYALVTSRKLEVL